MILCPDGSLQPGKEYRQVHRLRAQQAHPALERLAPPAAAAAETQAPADALVGRSRCALCVPAADLEAKGSAMSALKRGCGHANMTLPLGRHVPPTLGSGDISAVCAAALHLVHGTWAWLWPSPRLCAAAARLQLGCTQQVHRSNPI